MRPTRTLHFYGCRFDQVAAVRYLIKQHHEWTTKYRLFANHGQAMDIIADELSQECGLTLRAIPVWMGSGRTGYAMVFPDGSMGPKELTHENVESLKKMERFLESAGILEVEGFKLEHLYSALCLGHYDEPPEMARKPLPQGWAAKTDEDLHNLLMELKEKRRESAKGSRRTKTRVKSGKSALTAIRCGDI